MCVCMGKCMVHVHVHVTDLHMECGTTDACTLTIYIWQAAPRTYAPSISIYDRRH